MPSSSATSTGVRSPPRSRTAARSSSEADFEPRSPGPPLPGTSPPTPPPWRPPSAARSASATEDRHVPATYVRPVSSRTAAPSGTPLRARAGTSQGDDLAVLGIKSQFADMSVMKPSIRYTPPRLSPRPGTSGRAGPRERPATPASRPSCPPRAGCGARSKGRAGPAPASRRLHAQPADDRMFQLLADLSAGKRCPAAPTVRRTPGSTPSLCQQRLEPLVLGPSALAARNWATTSRRSLPLLGPGPVQGVREEGDQAVLHVLRAHPEHQ